MTSPRERRQGPTSISSERGTTETLSLPDELILMLLNEENGYFHQVPGWNLNCVVIGAVLAELSLMNRIDTDLESLFLIDNTETGNPILDPALQAIAAETGHQHYPVLDRAARPPCGFGHRVHPGPAREPEHSPTL